MTMTMTVLEGAELPLKSAADAPGTKFTEEQARQWLAERDNGTSVRQLAKLWGWHPSKVQRFLSRVRGETPRETLADTPRDTPNVSADTPETPQGQGLVDDGPPIAVAPYRDDFDWSAENGDVIVAPQKAIAIYRNAWGQIVIRAAASDYGEEDSFVAVAPEHVPALIAKLSAILKEVG